MSVMKQRTALEELRIIMKETSIDTRESMLQSWEDEWIYSIEKTQQVVNKSVLSTEDIDFTWHWVAKLCAEDLLDNNIAHTETTNTSFTTKIMTLRSPICITRKESSES